MLSAVLAEHVIEDVSVEDPPLEEVIAQVFCAGAAATRINGDGNAEPTRDASAPPPLTATH